ncbi:MAG: BMP family ABC transporter substrate-binding protein [Stomatobaculum sp.]|nr:BMP family ABC transporter substrate-binding protein [Stomatobaculum sp.]
MRRKTVLFLLGLLLMLLAAACGASSGQEDYNGEYKVAMITDAADITDQSFNQMTYEACREWCTEHKIPFTYKKPEGDTDYARVAMVDVAVAEGYNIIVMPGYIFARTLVEVTHKYPEIKFISLDLSGGDIIASAVGDAYYADPGAYNVSDYYNTENTYCAIYQEQIPGYLAGYAAVKMGYRKLGFLGGMAVPGVMRYGYGFLQGINEAAKELDVTDEVSVQYAYGGQFYGSTEITAAMDTWYSKGTEIVFACGGAIFTSAAEAAAKTGGKVIGVDSDQAPIIDAYGEKMTVTSAMKNLGATVFAMLDSIIIDGTWEQHVGKIESLGLVSGTDDSLNYVGLPGESTQWNEGFSVEEYYNLLNRIYEGEIKISDDLDHIPEVDYQLNVREGTIK